MKLQMSILALSIYGLAATAYPAEYTLNTNVRQEQVLTWYAERLRADCLAADPSAACSITNDKALLEIVRRWYERASSEFLQERANRAATRYDQLTVEQKALFDAMVAE